MKFQLKALAVALALSATVPAQAAISLGSTGNGSFVLSVFNQNTSATFDLGYTYNQFNSLVATAAASTGGVYTWNLAAGDYAQAWSSYSSSSLFGSSNWAVLASDVEGSPRTAGAFGFYTTTADKTLANALTTTTDVQQGLRGFDDYLIAVNNLGNHGTVASGNGASTATPGDASAFGGSNKAYGSGAAGTAGGVAATSGLNTDMYILKTLTGGTGVANTLSLAGNTQGLYTFNLSSNGLLTLSTSVSAVPEADSYAMLLVGLGVIGLVARRRKA